MRVTVPLVVTDAMLVSSSVPERFTPSAFNSGLTYARGVLVSVAADFSIYESLVDSNTGHTPSISPGWWKRVGPTEDVYSLSATYVKGATACSLESHRVYESLQSSNTGNPLPIYPIEKNDWWIDVGPMNKYAMFDLKRNTRTVNPSSITVVVRPGERINTLGILGMVADQIQITATSSSGGGVVYSYSENLIIRQVLDHYMYAYEPFSRQPSTVVFDVPPFTDLEVTVTISRGDGPVKCGSFVQGTYAYIGDTQFEAESDATNFSLIERDAFGDLANLKPRRSVPKTNQTLQLDKSKVNRVYALRDALNAVPALWTGLDDANDGYFEALMILGIYKRFTINVKNAIFAVVSLELEEI